MNPATDPLARGKLVEALRAGLNVTAAARAAGLARSQVYRAARSDPGVKAALEVSQRQGGRGRRRSPGPGGAMAAAAGEQAAAPGTAVDRGAVDGPPEERARLRRVGLAVLEEIATRKTEESRDRVAAARGLLAAVPVVASIGSAGPGGSLVVPDDPAATQKAGPDLKVLEGARDLLAQLKASRGP